MISNPGKRADPLARDLGERAALLPREANPLGTGIGAHHDGKSVVSHGTREKAEIDVARLHAHGLWATMERDRP